MVLPSIIDETVYANPATITALVPHQGKAMTALAYFDDQNAIFPEDIVTPLIVGGVADENVRVTCREDLLPSEPIRTKPPGKGRGGLARSLGVSGRMQPSIHDEL